MKKTLSVILVVLLLLSATVPASGTTPEAVTPRYTHTASISASLPTIDPTWGIATCTSAITASYYLPVKVLCELQRYTSEGWVTIKSWEATGTMQAAVQGKYALYTHYWYRVKTTGYVYSDDNVLLETTTVTSPEQYYTGN